MLNKTEFIFLLFIGIVYGQFNIAGIWNMNNSFPIASPGCCPLSSPISQIGQWANNIYTLTVNFGTGTGCSTAIAGVSTTFYSSGPFTGLYVPAYTGLSSTMTMGSFGYYPHNNSFILIFQTCEYIFTQSTSTNTSLTNYNMQGIYSLSSYWVTPTPQNQAPIPCCLPVDNKLIVASVSGMVSLTANYGTTNQNCYVYSLRGQTTSPLVSLTGGGFITGPYVASFFSTNNTLLLSYGSCMAYYNISDMLVIGLSLFVGLIAML